MQRLVSGELAIPSYDNYVTYQENFHNFFAWAMELDDPAQQIVQASTALGLPVKQHPLGFTVAYLSQPPTRASAHPKLLASSGLIFIMTCRLNPTSMLMASTQYPA